MSNFLDYFSFLNPISKKFVRNQRFDRNLEKQIEQNSVGMSDVEFDLAGLGIEAPEVGASADILQRYVNFTQIFQGKRERISKYREMSFYPEISEALDILCDEAVVSNNEGDIVHLNLLKEMPKRIEKTFHKEFDYIVNDVIKARDNLYDLYYKWLVEAELFAEIIIDKAGKKVIGYKVLPAFTTFPIYSKSGKIIGFAQSVMNEKTGTMEMVPLEGNQISYSHWGKFGKDLLDIRGYLETSVRTYNQLKSLEDSLIVFRLVRAPERRVWNIEVGRIPTQKAEQFIRKVIHKYKKQLNYNPATGAVDAARNVQSLSEDFWFAKRDGNGTTVDTVGGSMNLGELEDVRYFLSKMYKTLKLPKTRWDAQLGQQSYQSRTDIDREEIKFTLFVERTQNRFKKFIKDLFIEHIRFKFGNVSKYKKWLRPRNFDISFTPANFFKEMKDMELMETRLGVLGSAIAYASTVDEPHQPFSMEFILKRYFQMTDEEYQENQRLLKKEKEENLETREDEEEAGFGDDEGGGGDDEGGGGDDEGGEEEEPEKQFGPGSAEEPDEEPEEEDESVDPSISQNGIQQSKSLRDFLQRPSPKRRKLL